MGEQIEEGIKTRKRSAEDSAGDAGMSERMYESSISRVGTQLCFLTSLDILDVQTTL